MDFNICLATDSYKPTHGPQYPKGSQHVYSYFEARSKPEHWANEVVFFGLQPKLHKLAGNVVTLAGIQEAEYIWGKHLGPGVFNTQAWMHILEAHNGRLPVSIRAVQEGCVLPIRNVLITVENTDPLCWWLTNWLETYLSQVWYPCTVATQSRDMKRILRDSLRATGDENGLSFKLHDFGFRGTTSLEQAAIGGAAHLVNFQGTDTMPGIMHAREHYHADMPGLSIPASEHSTITSWGEDHELDAFSNMLDTYPTGPVACVIDSYDAMRACKIYFGSALKEKILARDGTLVVRPDSGDPATSVLSVLMALGESFGYTTNDKGYKVLPPQVRVIQGDGVDRESLKNILDFMLVNKWSTDNIAFGSGGGLLQKLNRDTLGFAFKCSHIRGEGFERDVYKNPVTMQSKASKRGRLKLVYLPEPDEQGLGLRSWNYQTVRQDDPAFSGMQDQLVEVFRNGKVLEFSSFEQVRWRAEL